MTMLGVNPPEQSGAASSIPVIPIEADWRQAETDHSSGPSAAPDWSEPDAMPARMPPGTKIAFIAVGFGVLAALIVALAVAIRAREKGPTAEQPTPSRAGLPTKRMATPVGRRTSERVDTERTALEREERSARGGYDLATWIIACILVFVCWILLLAWVARDAKNRCIDGGAVWVLLVVFLNFIGLLIYMASRPHGMLTTCYRCQNRKLNYARVCPHCGHEARDQV